MSFLRYVFRAKWKNFVIYCGVRDSADEAWDIVKTLQSRNAGLVTENKLLKERLNGMHRTSDS